MKHVFFFQASVGGSARAAANDYNNPVIKKFNGPPRRIFSNLSRRRREASSPRLQGSGTSTNHRRRVKPPSLHEFQASHRQRLTVQSTCYTSVKFAAQSSESKKEWVDDHAQVMRLHGHVKRGPVPRDFTVYDGARFDESVYA